MAIEFNLETHDTLSFSLGEARLVQGPKGDKGDTGLSAYEYAVSKGYSGSEDDFAEYMVRLTEYAANAAESAELSAGHAADAAESAEAAARSADHSEQYGAHPTRSVNGTWRQWDPETGEYFDTGEVSVLIDENSGRPVRVWFGTIEQYNALALVDPDVNYYLTEIAV